MKKIIFFISMIFFYAASTYAQSEDWRGGYEELLDEQEGVTANGKWWKTDDCENFTLIQVGYMSDTYNGDGFFVGYKHGWNITGEKLPLYIEPGVEFQYIKFGFNRIGFEVPVDFSYKFKTGDFSISPITGPTLRYAHDWGTGYYSSDEFIFGWDFGGRIAYKKCTLSYRYNKTISGDSWNTHQIGIGFTF